MRRIGILTFWGVPNYGAWTQAYALNKILNSMVKDDVLVEHIAYLHPKHYELYYKKDKRLENSFSYSWNCIPHTRVLTIEELENEYFDVIITGSDAIWEFSIDEFGDDVHLIGNRLNAGKIISYAASFGTMTIDEADKDFIRDGLKEYMALSVRDENSANIVRSFVEKNVELVIDPALVWDFRTDSNVVMPTYEKYIAVYGGNWDEEFITEVCNFAKEKKLTLISIGYINPWCDMSLKMIELRTLEWIGMIKKAEYVVTSTFHGLMLGINFRKQIKFNKVPYVSKRSQTLIEELKIPQNISQEIDYEWVEKKLFLMREHAFKYLEDNL